VEAATAVGFVNSSDSAAATRRVLRRGLDGSSQLTGDVIRERFFHPGPAYIFQILQGVDDRLKFYDSTKLASMPCAGTAPVQKDVPMFGGEVVSFYAQCYSGSDTEGTQFGVFDKTTYLVLYGGPVGDFYARIQNTTSVVVDIWMAVGAGPYPPSRTGTYITTRIHADPANKKLEFAVAGLGTGFCGVSVKMTADAVNATGSQDPCNPTESICVSPTNITQVVSCTVEANHFELTPLGRLNGTYPNSQAFAESYYPGPGKNQIKLRGDVDDSVYFGTPHWGNRTTGEQQVAGG
jgi:hypothetical protein